MNLSPFGMFIALVVTHFLADFPLQGDFLAKAKNRHTPIPGTPWWLCLIAHAAICGGAVWLVTGKLSLFFYETLAHIHTDIGKINGVFGTGEKAFVIDQAVHIGYKAIWVLLIWGGRI